MRKFWLVLALVMALGLLAVGCGVSREEHNQVLTDLKD